MTDRQHLLDLLLQQGEEYALILLDANGRVVEWLMGAQVIFGRARTEMLGQTIHCLFTPEDRERGVPEMELDGACRARSSEDDRWMLRSDNARFWASGVLVALRDAAGDVCGYAKLVRDRTDLRGQVETLRNRVDAALDEERRNVILMGTLAHEIRSPLSALSNAIALIDLAPSKDERLGYAVPILKRQTSYLGSLVDDWLELVRVRLGKAVLRLERVDLGAIVDAAVETVAGDVAARRQHVEVLLQPTPITLDADPVRLTQVLVNLLNNASKFSRIGAPIWIKTSIEGDEVVVRVEDFGSGISAEALPHVFELLSQAGGRAGDRGGIGVGLSIVKEYVELHGGSAQVRSEGIERGSEFTVRLPLVQRVASAQETE